MAVDSCSLCCSAKSAGQLSQRGHCSCWRCYCTHGSLILPARRGAASSLAQSQKVVMVVLTLAVGVVAWLILRRIQSNFREMSRIIVRIDRRYGMSDQSFDEFGPLFPSRWTQKKSLARRGWSDFIIDSLKGTIVVTTILNCFLVAFVVFQQEIMEYLARNHRDVCWGKSKLHLACCAPLV